MSDQNDSDVKPQGDKKLDSANVISTFFKKDALAKFSLIISFFALISPGLNVYMSQFWKPDDLVVYFRLPEPTQIGTERLKMSFIFSNSGRNSAFIEDVSIIQILYKNKPNNSSLPDYGICKEQSVFPPDFRALMSPETRRLPSVDKKGRMSVFYTPTTIYLDGAPSQFSALNIDAGKQRAISAIFETIAVDWSKQNIVLLCPTIRFFDASGHSHTAICEGWQSDDVYSDDRHLGRRFGAAPGPARLLPNSGSNCRFT
jgi:hypothetical protein